MFPTLPDSSTSSSSSSLSNLDENEENYLHGSSFTFNPDLLFLSYNVQCRELLSSTNIEPQHQSTRSIENNEDSFEIWQKKKNL
jgi:hypothetical protein